MSHLMTLIFVLSIALLFGACNSSSKKKSLEEVIPLEETEQQEEIDATDEPEVAISFERINVKESKDGVNYSLNILLPKANNPQTTAIRDALVQGFFDTFSSMEHKSGESIRDFALRQMQELIADKNEMDEEDASEAWQMEFTIDTLRKAKRYIIFTASGYQYMGGAHGGSFGKSLTFRLSDGKQITEFFKNPSDPAIRPLLLQGLCEYFNQGQNPGTVTMDNIGDYLLTDVSELKMPADEPCLMPEGMLFTYAEYEIASYSEGMPEFVIPYKKLMPYLTDEVRQLVRP